MEDDIISGDTRRLVRMGRPTEPITSPLVRCTSIKVERQIAIFVGGSLLGVFGQFPAWTVETRGRSSVELRGQRQSRTQVPAARPTHCLHY